MLILIMKKVILIEMLEDYIGSYSLGVFSNIENVVKYLSLHSEKEDWFQTPEEILAGSGVSVSDGLDSIPVLNDYIITHWRKFPENAEIPNLIIMQIDGCLQEPEDEEFGYYE